MIRILTTLLLFLSCSLHAQEFPNLLSPTTVTTVSYWNLGESVQFNVKKSKQSFKGTDKKPKENRVFNYSFGVKVIDSTENSYVLEMKYGKFISDEKKKHDEQAIFDKLSSLHEGMKIIYRTNELGAFDTILNLIDLKEQLLETLWKQKEISLKEIKNPDDRQIYAEVFDEMISNFQDIENISALFMTDIIPLHGYAGIQMELSKAIDTELDYPCIGDFVLKGTGKLTLNSIVKAADEFNFISNDKPDPAELKAYIKMIAGIFFMGDRKRPEISNLSISMTTKNKIKIELSTGWVKKASITSTVTVKEHKNSWKKKTISEYVKN